MATLFEVKTLEYSVREAEKSNDYYGRDFVFSFFELYARFLCRRIPKRETLPNAGFV